MPVTSDNFRKHRKLLENYPKGVLKVLGVLLNLGKSLESRKMVKTFGTSI